MLLIQYAHEKMYKMLKKELDECLANGTCKNSIEECFIIAGNYWSELRSATAEYKFITEEEEILFFKTVKPLFTSELEYYSLLYHTLLFCPFDPERQKQFWERESKRLRDFKEQHPDFLIYHSSGKTDKDKCYYLRASASYEVDDLVEAYDKEPKSRSSHDYLIAKLWALERYNDYAKGKLEEIGKLT
jgi:hypothetical protein